MKFDYNPVINALRQEARSQAQVQPLRNDRCQPIFGFHPHPTSKVFLLFHSFTAAPYQFADIAQALFEEGYNVVVPLLPGHGLAGSWNQIMPPPLPLHRRVYEEFALRWFKRSRVLGQTIALGGVGTGGTLAAWLGLQSPQAIDRLFLLDPCLPNVSRPHGSEASTEPFIFASTLVSPFVTTPHPDATGELYRQWIIPRQEESLPGYEGFSQRSLQVWFDITLEIQKRSLMSPLPPVLLVGSERERALGDETSRLFCEQVRQYQAKAWHLYCDRVLDLSHAFLTSFSDIAEETHLTRLLKQYANLELAAVELAGV